MAQVTVVEFTDDLDGSTGTVETVRFALDGVAYEIDLTAGNAESLRRTMATYVAAARRTGGRKIRGTATAGTASGEMKAVREWAKNHGHAVSDRGRLPASVVDAYRQAQRTANERKEKRSAAASTRRRSTTARSSRAKTTTGKSRANATRTASKVSGTRKRGRSAN